MSITPIGAGGASPFDQIRRTRTSGSEYWSARDLADTLGYDQWRNFCAAVDRARVSIQNQQGSDAAENHIAGASKMVAVGSGAQRAVDDWHLTRFGAYVVVMNGDPRKPEIAAAQAYFAVKTREAETTRPELDLTSLESISAILDAGKAALNRAVAAEKRALELEGPAAERDAYRAAEGLQLVGDVANRFKAYAASRFPGVRVLHEDVRNHAGRLGIIIRGNTVRNNQPTAQAIDAGWAKPAETLVETKNHGDLRKVTARLTPKGEARLWDGLCAYVIEHGILEIKKEIAA